MLPKILRLLPIMMLIAGSSFASIDITIVSLIPYSATDSTLNIQVNVQSTYSIHEVTAVVMDRTTSLSYYAGASGYNYAGSLSLKGLPYDTLTLKIYVTDDLNNRDSATRPFIYRETPTVKIIAPAPYSVARPDFPFHLVVNTHDSSSYKMYLYYRQPSCCTGNDPDRYALISANTADSVINTSVNVSHHEGEHTSMPLEVYFSGNQYYFANIPLYVESSPYLEKRTTVQGLILDMRYGRILSQNGLPVLTDSATGLAHTFPDSSILFNEFEGSGKGFITPYGAVIGFGNRIIDWRWENNTYTVLDSVPYIGLLAAAGKYVAWTNNNRLYLHDLENGNTALVSATSPNTALAVSPDGTVVYTDQGNTFPVLNKYKAQVITTLTTDFNGSVSYKPLIANDSTIFFARRIPNVSSAYDSLFMYRNGTVHFISRYQINSNSSPNNDYYGFNNNYLGFTKTDSTGVTSVWLRKSDGTEQRKTYFSSGVAFNAINSKGDILYDYTFYNPATHVQRRQSYFVGRDDNGANAQAISNGSYGSPNTYSDTSFFITVGNTLFHVNTSNHPADSLKEEVRTIDAGTTYHFALADFAGAFGGPGQLTGIKITGLPKHGSLSYSTIPPNYTAVNENQTIASRYLNTLRYVPAGSYVGNDTIYWKATNGIDTTAAGIFRLQFIPPVAIQLDTFTVQADDAQQHALLHWTTSTEKKIRSFNVYRSKGITNGNYAFELMATVPAKGGIGQFTTYDVTDSFPGTGINYYFLLIRDSLMNGIYSDTISVNIMTIQPPQVQLQSFTAAIQGEDVQLQWQTVKENKLTVFELQRKDSSGNFITIYTAAPKGSLTQTAAYQYTDTTALTGLNYYRLKTTGTDRFVAYSDTISANISEPPLVQLQKFNLHKQGDEVILQWQTTKESNLINFELQRKGNTGSFTTIYTTAAKGSLSQAASYQYADGDPFTGKNEYRLKINGKQGFTRYSDTLSVDIPPTFAQFWAIVWPNPVFNGPLNLSLLTARQRALQVSVVSVNGTVMSTQLLTIAKGSLQKQIAVSTLPSGLYFVVITDGHMKRVLPFIKLK